MTGCKGRDEFVFNAEDLMAGTIDEITDFTVNQDSIIIQGVAPDANVSYNSSTGIVSIDGEAFLQLDEGLGEIDFDIM